MTTKSTTSSFTGNRVATSGVSPSLGFNLPYRLDYTNFITGEDSATYRQTIKNGSSAVNSLLAVKHTLTVSEGTITGTYDWLGKDKVDTYSGPPEMPFFNTYTNPDFSKCENIAAGELASAVSRAVSEFKGAVSALEAPKTAAMIHGRASALMNSFYNLNEKFIKLRKRAKRNPKKFLASCLRDARGFYLEYSYGWSPLLSDISSLSEELNRKLNLSQRVSAVGTENLPASTSFGEYYPGTSNCPTIRTEVNKVDLSVRYVGAIDFSAGVGTIVPPRFGFNHEEFLPTVWELIPWSFVADYFSNISQVINYHAYSQIKFRYLSRNTRVIAARNVTCRGYQPKGSSSWLKSCTGVSSYDSTYQRLTRNKVDPSLPSVDFALEIPKPLQLFNTAVLISTLT